MDNSAQPTLHADRRLSVWFFAALALHLLIWTLVPTLLHPNAPFDVIEGSNWGREWQLGYSKHPPLQAWLLEISLLVAGPGAWRTFLLSQVAVLATIFFTWRLARQILPPIGAFVAAMALEGVYYFNFTSPEFNPNVLQMPVWAAASWVFFRCLTRGGQGNWILLGVVLAIGAYAKYVVVLLLIPIAILLVTEPIGRQQLRTSRPWLAAAIFMALLLPHVVWLVQHDWLPLHYVADRASPERSSAANHLIYPARFLGVQALAALPLFLLLLVTRCVGPPAHTPLRLHTSKRFACRFVTIMLLAPIVAAAIGSAILGMRLKSMWGAPMLPLAGIATLLWLQPRLDVFTLRVFLRGWMIVFILAPIAFAVNMIATPQIEGIGRRGQFPGEDLAAIITETYRQQAKQPLRYVVGSDWYAGNVALYSPDRPSIFIDANLTISPWIDIDDLHRRGGVVVWEAHGTSPRRVPARYAQAVPNGRAIVQPALELPWRTSAAIEPVRIGWAIIPPAKSKVESAGATRTE